MDGKWDVQESSSFDMPVVGSDSFGQQKIKVNLEGIKKESEKQKIRQNI